MGRGEGLHGHAGHRGLAEIDTLGQSDTISDMSPGPKVAEVVSACHGAFPLAPQPRGQV